MTQDRVKFNSSMLQFFKSSLAADNRTGSPSSERFSSLQNCLSHQIIQHIRFTQAKRRKIYIYTDRIHAIKSRILVLHNSSSKQ